MLVLSRRADESIVFPSIGVTIKLIKLDRSKAKLGISAPPEIRILREEVEVNRAEPLGHSDSSHEERNRLNTISLSMLVYKQQIEAGNHEAASQTFEKLLKDLLVVEPPTPATPATPEPNPVDPLRLLLVEDDVTQRNLLGGYLRHRGCEIETAGTACEASGVLSRHRQAPDFVLLDLNLPNSSGAETIRTIRNSQHGESLRILAVSATGPDSMTEESHKELRVDRWFSKPTNPEALLAHMTQRMHHSAKVQRA